ncbi:MAG: BON domain-containing protein [Gemmataceae bacterium]|nr:BON domain-containing protein [Gemmataceae bacterium]
MRLLWSLTAAGLVGSPLLAQTNSPAAIGGKLVQTGAPTTQASGSNATSAPARAANQALADAVAQRLRNHPASRNANITVVAQEGTVTLHGTVGDAQQKVQLLAEARAVSGVHVVRDNLQVVPGIVPAQNTQPAPAAPQGATTPLIEPAPLGMPGQLAPELQAPPLPPYAWPTYAPYPNFSRVAYPTAYPYNAFPFIGPFYPFPKVPLGWRKVTLEWEDGYWFYGRNSTPHDYWRVRFW